VQVLLQIATFSRLITQWFTSSSTNEFHLVKREGDSPSDATTGNQHLPNQILISHLSMRSIALSEKNRIKIITWATNKLLTIQTGK
jgi:hypothetical protein